MKYYLFSCCFGAEFGEVKSMAVLAVDLREVSAELPSGTGRTHAHATYKSLRQIKHPYVNTSILTST